jgi:hypothetical protein
MTFFLKTLLAIVIVGAIFLTNLIWFRPWSLNLFYEKAFVEVIFNEPELLTSLGLVEQFGITRSTLTLKANRCPRRPAKVNVSLYNQVTS